MIGRAASSSDGLSLRFEGVTLISSLEVLGPRLLPSLSDESYLRGKRRAFGVLNWSCYSSSLIMSCRENVGFSLWVGESLDLWGETPVRSVVDLALPLFIFDLINF